jgi:cytochrome oxidase Cu insertion factor (SCO1/SenC/PrrC family)
MVKIAAAMDSQAKRVRAGRCTPKIILHCITIERVHPAPTMPPRAIRVDYPITPPDVPMVNQDGQPARLSDFRGKLTLIFFSDIACQDVCVDGLGTFEQVKRRMRRSCICSTTPVA